MPGELKRQMNQEKVLTPRLHHLFEQPEFRSAAEESPLNHASTASAPNTPLFMPIITPLEKIGSTKAKASPTMM